LKTAAGKIGLGEKTPFMLDEGNVKNRAGKIVKEAPDKASPDLPPK